MARLRFIKKHNQYQIDYYQDGKRIRYYLGSDKKNAEKELKRVEAFVKARKLGFRLHSEQPDAYTTSPPPNPATFKASPETKRITIEEAINRYLERCKEVVQSGNMTEETYEFKVALLKGRFSTFLKKRLPHSKFLDEIEKTHIESYRTYRLNSRHKFSPRKKISPTSVNNDLRDLTAFFNYCIENRNTFHITLNPASKVKKVPRADKSECPPCLSHEEIKQTLHECKDDLELRNVIEAFLETAMRYNELRNLRWKDINFEKGLINIKSREGFVTKSRRSRTIPMSQRMGELLKKLARRSEKVFDLNDVQKIKAKKDNLCNIRKRMERLKKRLPFLGAGHRFHIFRHTAITRWANSGVPLPIVQKWAGHSSIEMTMKYVHPSEEESAQWMNKFSSHLTPPSDTDLAAPEASP